MSALVTLKAHTMPDRDTVEPGYVALNPRAEQSVTINPADVSAVIPGEYFVHGTQHFGSYVFLRSSPMWFVVRGSVAEVTSKINSHAKRP